jgi:hypothetical protein
MTARLAALALRAGTLRAPVIARGARNIEPIVWSGVRIVPPGTAAVDY